MTASYADSWNRYHLINSLTSAISTKQYNKIIILWQRYQGEPSQRLQIMPILKARFETPLKNSKQQAVVFL